MIAPATAYSIKGALWYQSESDSMGARAPLYERNLPRPDYRLAHPLAPGDFPFLYVQISSCTSSPAEVWGTVREAQRRTLNLVNTAMVVTFDVGDSANVHPSDKQSVAGRLALAARATVYGEKI